MGTIDPDFWEFLKLDTVMDWYAMVFLFIVIPLMVIAMVSIIAYRCGKKSGMKDKSRRGNVADSIPPVYPAPAAQQPQLLSIQEIYANLPIPKQHVSEPNMAPARNIYEIEPNLWMVVGSLALWYIF